MKHIISEIEIKFTTLNGTQLGLIKIGEDYTQFELKKVQNNKVELASEISKLIEKYNFSSTKEEN